MAAALAAPGPRPSWRGTFLQLWAAHKEWPPERWTELFGYLRALGMREVIVQWSRYDTIDYGPEVERVIAAGFDVWMGLGYDSRWWQQPSPEMVRDAARGVPGLKGLRGFYLPQEIEDGAWAGKRLERTLADSIRAVRNQFHPLAVSGFTNRHGTPAGLARFWHGLQRRGRFDRLLFQDGIGSGKMPIAEWPDWAPPLSRALARRLTIVVESFTAEGEGASWHASPASWTRIEQQMRLATEFSHNAPISFSAPEYMTPLGGASAAKLFHQILLSRADTHQ
jgi:hypothetical protein